MASTDKGSGTTTSVWMATADVPPRPALDSRASCDVCVVGAGIAGLTTAYMLSRAGRSVIVLDDGAIGGGETSRTTAHLTHVLDTPYRDLEKLHGPQGAQLAAESHTKAIDEIEAIVRSEDIACGFERLNGYLFGAQGDDGAFLDDEVHAVHRAGLAGVTKASRSPLAFDTGPCLCFTRQAQFHPMKYLAGLALGIERAGGRICTATHVTGIKGGASAEIATKPGHSVSAASVVVATNTPVNNLVAVHTKQAAYRTYVVGLPVPRGVVPRALYWDTADPYHYVRLTADGDGGELLIVGGEDHKTGQADDARERFRRLDTWARVRFPIIGEARFCWSGQVMEPVDGLGFIGRNPVDANNVFIATGDSGNGMTNGTIAGRLITDLVSGTPNRWATLYDPSRVTVRSARDFAAETLNVAAQYVDLVTRGDIDSPDDLLPGTGAVMRRGLKKVAVYKDRDGRVTELSAVCPHLGCVVKWNGGEKTWDCPCHGSRFDTKGRVLNGPAISNLPPHD